MVAARLPYIQKFVDQSNHNYNFLCDIDKDRYLDWVITASFYTVLHIVNAHAAARNHPFKKIFDYESIHTQRIAYVRSNLRDKYTDFIRLINESFNARYDALYFQNYDGDINEFLKIAEDFRKIAI